MINSTPPVEIISFGYGHGPSPEAHTVVDVRAHFRDPHVDPALRYLTAEDVPVMRAVLATPGVCRLVQAVVALAHAYRRGPTPGPVVIAVGCVGGRHRSAGVAIEAARILRRDGVPAAVSHRDLHRPVIGRANPGTAA
jgi:RNase adaptor protein for sRNA GlmZ degradation